MTSPLHILSLALICLFMRGYCFVFDLLSFDYFVIGIDCAASEIKNS